MENRPTASVIIPCDGRPCLVEALRRIRESRPRTPYEVVVVGELPPGCPPLQDGERLVPDRGNTTGEMRNRAAAAARGEVLLFTDSDCIVDDRWLDGAAAACTPERPVVAGGIRFPETSAQDCGDNLAIFHGVHVSQRAGRAEGKVLGTNNLAVRREVFERVGGFDPSMSSGEDMEFLGRVSAAGVPLWFDPGFAVLHQSGRTSAEAIRRHARWYAEGTAKLVREGGLAGGGRRAEAWLGRVPGGAAAWSALKATLGLAKILAGNWRFARLAKAWPWAWYFLYVRRRELFRLLGGRAGK